MLYDNVKFFGALELLIVYNNPISRSKEMCSPLLQHYRQYAEYKRFYRKSSDNFVSFIEGYEKLKKEVEDSIFLKCSKLQIQILDLLSVCNIANDDVVNILETLEAEPSENPYDKIKKLLFDFASELEDLVDTKIELEETQLDQSDIKPKLGLDPDNSDGDSDYGLEEDNIDYDDDFKSPPKKRKYNKYPPIPQNENGRYICTRCGKDFPKAENVRLHLNKKKKCIPSLKGVLQKSSLVVIESNGFSESVTEKEKVDVSDDNPSIPQEEDDNDANTKPVKKRGRKAKNQVSEIPQNEDGRFMCIRCGRDFPRADNVRLHQNRKKICVPLVDKAERLKLIVQHAEEGKELNGDNEDVRQVDQIIKSPAARLDYEQIPKNKEGRFVCTRCGKDFPRAENVRNHQISLKQSRCVPINQEQYLKSVQDLKWEHEVIKDETKSSDKTAIKIKIVKKEEMKIRLHEELKDPFSSEHSKETHLPKRYECDQCLKDFPTPEKVLAHKMNLGCIKNRTYKWASKVEAVEIEDSGKGVDGKQKKKKFKYIGYCKFCDHKTTPPAELKRHVKDVHFKERKQCPICGKMIRIRGLPFHMRKHEAYESGPDIKCDMCTWTTKVKEHLPFHIRRVHGEKNISCEICGERFSYGAALTKHVQLRHGEDLLCSHCDFKTKDIITLKSHLKRFHTKPGSFLCTRCTFETTSSEDLKLHINSVHGGDIVDKALTTNRKEYKCDMCDHIANGKNSLRGHKASMHWNLQFKCEECDFVASYKLKLRDHVNRVHRGIKYDCKFCNFSTPNQKSHTTHCMNKHPEEFKLFYCHLCNYRTQHKDLLQRHLTGKYGKHNSNSYG